MLVDGFALGFSLGIRPDPPISLVTWSDERRILSSTASAEPGRWRTSRVPFMSEIMESLSVTSDVQIVALMKGAQIAGPLDIETPIPTPKGWTSMGRLATGDYVFNEKGVPCLVTGISDIFYRRDCWELTFSDGSTLISDGQHRWTVWKYKRKDPQTLTTDQIRKKWKQGDRNLYSIDVAGSLALPDQQLPISPYTLGVWLGDGNSNADELTLFSDDAHEISVNIKKEGYAGIIRTDKKTKGRCLSLSIDPRKKYYCQRGHKLSETGQINGRCAECHRIRSRSGQLGPIVHQTFHSRLAETGQLGNKHIPSSYLRASHSQRLALIQGLMDTDGTVSRHGWCSYTTVSPELKTGIMELLRSVGLKPTCKESIESSSVGGFERKSPPRAIWIIGFVAYQEKPVFRLNRKLKRLKPMKNGRLTETCRRRIVDVRPVDSRPVRCIEVDTPSHLFLAGHAMIPTHNTEIGNNWCGYVVDHVPGPMMVVQPTIDMGKRWSKQRFSPMLQDMPCLAEKISDSRSRDSGNTLLSKEFDGGIIIVSGANSASSLRSMPVRFLFLDEVDAYPLDVDGEGDPVDLAVNRTKTFSRKKIFMPSTPTTDGQSRIQQEFLAGDQRYYHVPCPDCTAFQKLEWSQITWDQTHGHKPETAAYVCIHCGSIIQEHHKTDMLAKGHWVPENPNAPKHRRSYNLSSLYSPLGWESWAEIVQHFLDSKNNIEKLKTWTNTSLAEVWKEEVNAVSGADLFKHAQPYQLGTIQSGGLVLTAGVDTQDNRLEAYVYAWGEGEECWLVDYRVFYGDPGSHDLWHVTLAGWLWGDGFRHVSGQDVHLEAVAVDTGGHYTHEAYAFCRAHQQRGVMAVKGSSKRAAAVISKPKLVDINIMGRVVKNGVLLWSLGTDTAKGTIYGRFLKNEDGPGRIHYPDTLPLEIFDQLTAEKLKKQYRNGYELYIWVKKSAQRNEALDCLVYAYAAALKLGIDSYSKKRWQKLRDKIEPLNLDLFSEALDMPPVPVKQKTKTNVGFKETQAKW